jgi:phospholipid/cholesterol/gamma-HCH transport system permease protein
VIERIDKLGASAIGFGAFFRDISVLLYGTAKSLFVVRWRGAKVVWDILLAQIHFTGAQGVALSAFAALAVGTLILIEAVTFIPSSVNIAHLVALIIVKDVAPLLTAIIIIGRSGTAIAVELANMRLNGEMDALVSMGLPLEHVIVLPRVVGTLVAFVGMVVASSAAALVGGYLVAARVIHMPFTLVALIENIGAEDTGVALLKAVLMGAAIPVICVREGFSVKVSARQVPQAATRAVVNSMTFCLVLNSFVSIYT